MAVIRNVTEYQLSRDYDLLFELMHKSSIICIVDCDFTKGDSCRDVAQTLCREGGGDYLISCRGTGYVWAEDKEDFVRQCKISNLEFILPNGVQK